MSWVKFFSRINKCPVSLIPDSRVVEDSNSGGPSSVTATMEYLFAFQIRCYEFCVEKG